VCGRFVAAKSTPDLVTLCDIDVADPDLPGPSYNIAPTQTIRLITATTSPDTTTEGRPQRRLQAARWGLVNSFKRSPTDKPTPFNARSETIASNGLFRRAFSQRRAIIPASGFYERRRSGDRQSFYIHPGDDTDLALAGLYEWWHDPQGGDDDPAAWLLSTTIITQPAHQRMVGIHDRQPLCLTPDLWDDWLDPGATDPVSLLHLVCHQSTSIDDSLDFRPIGPAWLASTGPKHQNNPSLITVVAQSALL